MKLGDEILRIIGINSKYDAGMNEIYSGGCAYICDGEIIIALAEDRISRKKNDGGFKESLAYIYGEYNLTTDDIDYFYISFYANPLIPNEEMIKLHLKLLGIEKEPEKLVVMPSHHLSHACLAYFLSPFEDALIMVADNEGCLLSPKSAREKGVIFNDCERNSYYWAHGNCITLIDRDFQHSGEVCFGKAYNKFNEYIGFGSYLNVGKTMGLSSYGTDVSEWENIDLWYIDENGNLHSNITETHDSFDDITYFFKKHGLSVKHNLSYETDEYKNLAFFVQHQLNKWSVIKMQDLIKKYGIKNICVSGGVALNGIMNCELEKRLQASVFVPPYCSDPGQALGNAIYGYIQQSGKSNNSFIKKIKFENYIYLGTEYSYTRIHEELISLYKNDSRIEMILSDNIFKIGAEMIADGKIIGFYQGRSEYGARALGNRSILAAPNSIEIRDRVNTLKGRELFRPLAPAVISEKWDLYFDGEKSILDTMMLRVVNVKLDRQKEVCGITHIDGTARVQEVTKKINPDFYQLITEFYKITQIPMVINTSFNKAGEPIVESPKDAVESFLAMNLDGLICGNYLLRVRQ